MTSLASIEPSWPTLVDAQFISDCARRSFRGKRRRVDVATFLFEEERRLADLRERLVAGRYEPSRPELVLVRDPKPRVIARASLDDRIVQACLARLLEPAALRRTVAGDLACRLGGGTHRACARLLRAMRRSRFFLHLDVRQYFPSIDIERLSHQVRRLTRDERVLELVDGFLEVGRGLLDGARARRFVGAASDWPPPGRGIAIGSSLSQLLAAHVHLVELDHEITRRMGVSDYVRYVDDFFLFADRRGQLREARARVEGFLRERLDLRLKHPEAPVLSSRGHLDALGVRIRRSGLEVLPSTWRRWRGRIGRYVRRDDRRETAAALRRSLVGQAGTVFFG